MAIQLIRHKKLWLKHPIMPFIGLTAIASFYEYFGTIVLRITTIYWSQLYQILSILAVLYFFYKVLSSKYLIVIKILFFIFLIVYATSFSYLNIGIFDSTSLNRVPITTSVFLLSILWFKELFDKLTHYTPFDKREFRNLLESEDFYFVAGLFTYYLTTFFLFLSRNTIYESDLYFYDYWLINILATLVLRLFLIISVWKMKKV